MNFFSDIHSSTVTPRGFIDIFEDPESGTNPFLYAFEDGASSFDDSTISSSQWDAGKEIQADELKTWPDDSISILPEDDSFDIYQREAIDSVGDTEYLKYTQHQMMDLGISCEESRTLEIEQSTEEDFLGLQEDFVAEFILSVADAPRASSIGDAPESRSDASREDALGMEDIDQASNPFDSDSEPPTMVTSIPDVMLEPSNLAELFGESPRDQTFATEQYGDNCTIGSALSHSNVGASTRRYSEPAIVLRNWDTECGTSESVSTRPKTPPASHKRAASSDHSMRFEHKRLKIEEPLLQNLPGLSSVRVLNAFNEYSEFGNPSEYGYEVAPRAHASAYEPVVFRKNLLKPEEGPYGLCPYCSTPNFLSMRTSAYLHHLTISHGVFSNGTLVEEPGVKIEDRLTNSGKVEKLEFFTCPYVCALKSIRMKKWNKDRPEESRYKVYLRHVKDCHSCGKRDNQVRRPV